MKKILFVYGTRPEFIKLYPIIMKFKNTKKYDVITLNTGQHKEMLNNLLHFFDFKNEYDLEIMDKSNDLTGLLSNSLIGINEVIIKEKPDLIFIHGDTSATLAGAIQAFFHKIPLAHIEAGLRTYDKYNPFPEEINRQYVSLVADINFAPTDLAKRNLLKEYKGTIHVVGNSAIDMFKYTIDKNYKSDILEWVDNKRFIIMTTHRRENIDVMSNIFNAINEVAKQNNKIKIIVPYHLNPDIQKIARSTITSNNILLVKPLQVYDFHNLLARCYFIVTDSGGIQEEAPIMRKPVLVIRDTTERQEGIDAGTLKLIGTKYENIVSEINVLLENKYEYEKMSNSKNPYGDGTTSQKVEEIISDYFNNNDYI